MSILSSIQDDVKTAMRERQTEKVQSLRLLVNALQSEAKTKGVDTLDDADAIRILNRQKKQNQEAAEAFEQGGATDRAAAERRQIELVDQYLPEQLSDAELARIVDEAIEETGASSPKEMGQVMKAVMPKVGGRADGRAVSDAVKSRLMARA